MLAQLYKVYVLCVECIACAGAIEHTTSPATIASSAVKANRMQARAEHVRANIASNRPESKCPPARKKTDPSLLLPGAIHSGELQTLRALCLCIGLKRSLLPSCKTLCEEEKNITTCSAHTHTHAQTVWQAECEKGRRLKDRTEQEHIAPSHGVGPIVCVLCVYLHVCVHSLSLFVLFSR